MSSLSVRNLVSCGLHSNLDKQLISSPIANESPIRLVIEKLAAIGLLSSRSTVDLSRSPSLLPPLLPPLLAHLHPPPSSPLRPYPPSFLPSLLLPLPTSTLSSLVDALLGHLTSRLIAVDEPLAPDVPDQRISRAIDVLKQIVGAARPGGEAWNAVLASVLNQKATFSASSVLAGAEQAKRRLIVGWIAGGGESGEPNCNLPLTG